MKNIYYPLIALFVLVFTACDTDYTPSAIGDIDRVIVVMDSTNWDGETALALEETFGGAIETLPSFEPRYRLEFRDFRSNRELDNIRENRNVIFATPIDAETNVGSFVRAILSSDVENRVRQGDSFAFPIEDRWRRDQWVLVLTSTDDDELAEKIRNSEESLISSLEKREFDRREREVFRRGEQVDLNEYLWDNFGWKVRMQHDYIQINESEDAIVFGRYLPDNNRRMWAWWKDDVKDIDFLDSDWINATRDSLMQIYMEGESDGNYVTTEYRDPRVVKTTEIERDDHIIGFETMGTWRMVGNVMGGPFVNFTYYDPETERLFMVEYWQFAPSVPKRRFVRQFQAMGRTFESDSTWHERREEALSRN
ncbi:MAG: DUF4837 family protein [Balneolaceae bacterium]|nr:DUF4837 family protein [Balneolaceae bacterium]